MELGRASPSNIEVDSSLSWSSGSSRRTQRNCHDICDADREDLVNVDTSGECVDVGVNKCGLKSVGQPFSWVEEGKGDECFRNESESLKLSG